jgi:hypothetical protein
MPDRACYGGTLLFAGVLLISSSALTCFAQGVPSSELIEQAKDYDAKEVVFQGEAIGDVMSRGEYVWINVHDGENAIGIWAPKALAAEITATGGYKTTGDWLEVTGTFNRACPEHGGDLDIHAVLLRSISPGRYKLPAVNTNKRNIALCLAGGLCLVTILSRSKKI